MKRIAHILIISTIAIILTSCGGSIKSKIKGKWRWISSESLRSNDPIKMDDEELYMIFKDGRYLYHNASLNATENWTYSYPYKIDQKTKMLTILSGDAMNETEHYSVKFKGSNTLLLTNEDPSSLSYQSIWTLKRAK